MDVVGSYELLGRVTVTGLGQRWRGRDTMLGRDVSLRQIGQIGAGAVATIEAPRSAVRILAGLSHPNIVGLLDKVEADGQIWLIDEPVDGITLQAMLAGAQWPTPQQSVGVVRGVLKGLAYVHNRRALHGDINPATVLLEARGTARLTDFGLPVPLGAPNESTDPQYLSPEAASGLGLSLRSDVYSVGGLLAMLLPTEIDPRLRRVIDKAMAKDPTDRYLDAEEFLGALEDAAELSYGEDWLAEASVAELVRAVAGG